MKDDLEKNPHKKCLVYMDSTRLGGAGGGLNAILATQHRWGVSYEVASLRKNINTCDKLIEISEDRRAEILFAINQKPGS